MKWREYQKLRRNFCLFLTACLAQRQYKDWKIAIYGKMILKIREIDFTEIFFKIIQVRFHIYINEFGITGSNENRYHTDSGGIEGYGSLVQALLFQRPSCHKSKSS